MNFDVPTPVPSPVTPPKQEKKFKPGRQIYMRACKKFLLAPIKSIRDGLKREQLVCKYTTLREKDVEAIVLALVVRHYIDMPMQYTVIFILLNDDNFLMKKM